MLIAVAHVNDSLVLTVIANNADDFSVMIAVTPIELSDSFVHANPLRLMTPTIPLTRLWLQGIQRPFIIRSYRNEDGLPPPSGMQRNCGNPVFCCNMFMRLVSLHRLITRTRRQRLHTAGVTLFCLAINAGYQVKKCHKGHAEPISNVIQAFPLRASYNVILRVFAVCVD